ncbi:hypothetical protein IWX64_002556 [Arthrobacter sp. CAN_A212]|uniref:hypothetical protein n=1 Tax=Arthrobacter sp. CAN_A212 TaxID=2787719 RepID=UPI0018CAA282
MDARQFDSATTTRSVRSRGRRRGLTRKVVGGFFLFTGGIHLGIVAADPQFYAAFANEAVFPLVTEAWHQVFMAQPAAWGLALAVGEATLGVLLLRGGTAAKVGWLGVITFHLGLMVFGWGFWLWSVPFLAIVLPAALKDLRSRRPAGGSYSSPARVASSS